MLELDYEHIYMLFCVNQIKRYYFRSKMSRKVENMTVASIAVFYSQLNFLYLATYHRQLLA